jgi:hypothetical protein
MQMFYATLKYCRRVIRMTTLLAKGKIQWISYKMALRPRQIAVLAPGGAMLFCDQEDEDGFFGNRGEGDF